MGADAPPEARAEGITVDELQLAARNHALPLEALRYDIRRRVSTIS